MNGANDMSQQRGVTLVELMIALTLGAVVIAGVVQIFLSGQQSYRLQRGLGLVQDNGRTAVFFLHRGLRIAGLPRQGGPGILQGIVWANDDSGAPATRDGANLNDPDVITVMYQSNTNCLGQDTSGYPAAQLMTDPAGNFYTKDQYFIGPSTVGEAQLSLRCRALGLNNQQVEARTAALVDGIEDIQFLYGVDLLDATGVAATPTTRDFQVERYMSATAINALADPATAWDSVVSIRFAVLSTSLDSALDEPATTQFKLLDDATRAAFDDRIFRRVFRSTVEVRNSTP